MTAIFNDQIFTTQGTTPLTGEIIATYKLKSRSARQAQSVTYELHDKNALTWDDDRKVAAFITPQDSAVRNYASFIRQVHRDAVNPYISKNFQFAVQVFNALPNWESSTRLIQRLPLRKCRAIRWLSIPSACPGKP